MIADALLARLDGVRPTGQNRWIARCPAHDDRRASLSIRELDDGRLLVHDFAGCPVGDVVQAVGLTLADLFPTRQGLGHQIRREARPFPATDVLRALGHEATIVAIVAARLGNGHSLGLLKKITPALRMHGVIVEYRGHGRDGNEVMLRRTAR